MNVNPIAIAIATTIAATACTEPSDETSHEANIERLALDNGVELIFFAEPDDEVSILEVSANPSADGLIDQMNARGATPAELWAGLRGAGDVPEFLLAHHEANIEHPIVPMTGVGKDADVFRGWEYETPAWGGYDDYCRDDFPGEFEAYNPVTTSVSVSGFTGAPNADAIYGYSNIYVKQAWVAVCNHTSVNSGGTLTEIALSKWDASNSIWVGMLCDATPSGGWCLNIANQEAKALHYWTTVPAGQKLRFEAQWGAGVSHLSRLRAGYSTLSF